MAELSTGTMACAPRAKWPDTLVRVGPTGLQAEIASAGGLRKILPQYFAVRPKRAGMLLSEFLALGLMEKPPSEARNFVGGYGAARLALRINQKSNRRGLVADKLLCDATLRGAGLATPETIAVFGRTPPIGATHLKSRADLADLLKNAGPVFGKPAQGDRSQDVLALDGADGQSALSLDGRRLSVAEIWTHLNAKHKETGFLFQTHITQNPKIAAVVGRTVSTVRVITLFHEGRVHLYRAMWKLPIGESIADNFWRGNLMAHVDPESGEVGQAVNALSVAAPRYSVHPSQSVAFEGMVLPRWAKVKRSVRIAAGLFHMLPVIGWDIAIAPGGPIIVEANANPSLDHPQYLTGLGAFDGTEGERLALLESEVANQKITRSQQKRRKRRELLRQKLRFQ